MTFSSFRRGLLLSLATWLAGLSNYPTTATAGAVSPVELRCEYQINPFGLDCPRPRLSWELKSAEREQRQSSYEVTAGTTPGTSNLWDSGKVTSGEALNIKYEGKPLAAGERVWWALRVWDAQGRASDYCPPAFFEMGLLSASDWSSKWIQRPASGHLAEGGPYEDHPCPLLRKEFVLEKKIRRARAYVSGLGYYELRINGAKVGDHVLDPGWTSYSQRVLYSTYDVTHLLQRGQNAVGVILGNGWFNPLPLAMWGHIKPGDALTTGEPRAMVQLMIEYQDGTKQTIGSDATWRAGDGPILRNSVYLGEVYDARREQPGWDRAGFNDTGWTPAALATTPALGPLSALGAPPIRVTREMPAVRLTEPKPGVFIFDFGLNFAGETRLQVWGPSGTRVRLRFGELIYPDGTLNGMTSVAGQIKGGGPNYRYDGQGAPKTAFQLDEYVLKGDGKETYTPRFTFHGFRYVEVTGFPGKPDLHTLTGLRMNSDVTPAGTFACSNPLFNEIQDMVLRTELSNIFSVQSDCPHREKFGYGGDIVASSEMAMLNFDMARFYSKSARDLADAARPNGGFTETSPYVGIADESLGGQAGPVGWGTAEPLLLLQLRQYYGEDRPLSEQYAATKKWIKFLQASAPSGILDNGISDHESLVPKPRALTGTAFYYCNVTLFARLARALNHPDDAAEADALAAKIKSAFNGKFLDPATGRYDSGSQACQAFALYHGLAPAEETKPAMDVLLKDITTHDNHLTTGIFGTKYMLNALTDAGRADVAYEIVNQRTFPGWGNMIAHGATTLWEHWDFSDNVYSHNHPMFGSVSEWFYKTLAGIKPAPDAVGFNKVIIAPQPVGDLTWARGSYHSVRGPVESEWRREEGHFYQRVRIPVGVTAQVVLPSDRAEDILEGRHKFSADPHIRMISEGNHQTTLAVESGEYEFTTDWKGK